MMKNIRKTFLILAMVVTTMVCFAVSANAETEGYYTYSIANDEAKITGADKSIDGDVIIPSSLGGYRVTAIGKSAFALYNNIKSVIIPDSIITIEAYAFNSCQKLTSVKIGNNVTTIETEAFENCYNLSDVTIGNKVTKIGSGVFDDCVSLKNIIIPNSVTEIGGGAFLDCCNLASITIGNGITQIGVNAFCYCNNLTDVYYMGTQEQWNAIIIGNGNSALTGASIHYHNHSYKSVVTAPTCTKKGYTTYTCECGKSYTEEIPSLGHNTKTSTTKATLKSNGKTETVCSTCGYTSKTTTIYKPKTFTLSTTSYTYDGKIKTPTVTIKDSKGKTLKKDTDYTVSYEKGRKNPGEYTVTITLKGNYSGAKKINFTIKPKTVTGIKATQTTTSIKLTWSKVTGATGYVVYKYNTKTKKYEKVKDVKTNSLTISKLKAGTKYKYEVRAYTKDNGTIWGAYSKAFETATEPATPALKVKSTAKGKATLTWKNVAGESGYQVYYSTKKDSGFKKYSSPKANATKATVSKLTSGKTYYFRVRAYTKTASGTVYSGYKTVSVKVK